jgi:hypothetical protein
MWWAFAAGLAQGFTLFLLGVLQEKADAAEPDAESTDAAG